MQVRTKAIELRGAALDAVKDKSPELLLSGPAGTGKSFVALLKLHLMCLANPGMRAIMLRKTHKSLTATGLVTFREQVANEMIAAGQVRWYGGSAEKPAQYIYPNGSIIMVGGLDQADKIMSLEVDFVYVQEATDLTKDDWEKIGTRLRNGVVSFQQLLADCNPQHPSHWLKQRANEGAVTMLTSRHEDNPRLFTADGVLTEYGRTYIARLDALTGVRKERLRHGRWVAAEGMIYTEWKPDVHLMPSVDLPYDWERVWGVDFGFTNPFVWQQWAKDPDGRLILEHEIYWTQRLVEDHAREILKVVCERESWPAIEKSGGMAPGLKWKYPRPVAIICDHDAEDRATLERHLGMGTQPAWKGVKDGIEAMHVRLRVQENGLPRMAVMRDSLVARDERLAEAGLPTCFAEEIEGYVWKPGPDGKPVPDEPLKQNDHSMDTGRYVVAREDLAPRPRLRWVN